MPSTDLDDATLIHANPDVLVGDIDGEIVALNMTTGSYLHLNSSGSFIFNRLQDEAGKLLAVLIGEVRNEYAVDETLCRQEVSAFVARCIELDLLRRLTET